MTNFIKVGKATPEGFVDKSSGFYHKVIPCHNFETFVEGFFSNDDRNSYGYWQAQDPFFQIYQPDNTLVVKKKIKIENLEEECKTLGLNPVFHFDKVLRCGEKADERKINASRKGEDIYQNYYNTDLRRIVEDRWSDILQREGYKFNEI